MTGAEMAFKRLASQRLAENGLGGPGEVVAWMGAMQAQDYAMSKWALGLRCGAPEDEVEAAAARGEILRTHGPRPTWHFVTPADIRWLLGLVAPRVIAGTSGRWRELELGEETFRRSQQIFTRALEGGRQLDRYELRDRLEAEGLSTAGQRMPHLLMRAELDGLLVSGARKGKQHTYTLLEERVPPAPARTREEALAELTRRYFTSRGPARVQDFTWWSGLTAAEARAGIELNRPGLASETVDGQAYWFAADAPAAGALPDALLLPVYDELVVSYTKRDALLVRLEGNQPPHPRGFGLMQNLLLLDGQAAGAWVRSERKRRIEVAFAAFSPLSEAEMQAAEGAAQRFGKFYGLPVECRFA